jgi:hypothetical protein
MGNKNTVYLEIFVTFPQCLLQESNVTITALKKQMGGRSREKKRGAKCL